MTNICATETWRQADCYSLFLYHCYIIRMWTSVTNSLPLQWFDTFCAVYCVQLEGKTVTQVKCLHFYMKELYACVFDDANKCMFNGQMFNNITWPLRQVQTTVGIMWCPCNMTQPLFKLFECWQIRATSPCLRLWSSDRKERLPYQKRVADSSSSILGCCSWLMHGVDCQMNCYRQIWQCWSSLVWQPDSRAFYSSSFNCG